jgi:regulator of cell morphogenesis and NO signaling
MKPEILEVAARKRPLEARLREAFEDLKEGDSFLLRTDLDPRPIYHGFRAKYPDTFGWLKVAARPAEWEIEVLKHKPKESEEELGAYFARDHDEIDVLFDHLHSDVAEAASRLPGGPGLFGSFDEFDARLERHIRWEEEVLFPAVEEKAPDLALGPGRVMREEHERIRKHKSAARLALAGGERDRAALDAARRSLEQMRDILIDHNLKEEAVYYPMSDEMFSPAEAASLLARIRAISLGGAP